MASRSLNKIMLIGNLAERPELRTTKNGSYYCPFRVITDREWKTKSGEVKHEAQLHYCIAWDKLGELCATLLDRGTMVYIEGRIQTHRKPDGTERIEIMVLEMIILRRPQQKTVEEVVGEGGENAAGNQ